MTTRKTPLSAWRGFSFYNWDMTIPRGKNDSMKDFETPNPFFGVDLLTGCRNLVSFSKDLDDNFGNHLRLPERGKYSLRGPMTSKVSELPAGTHEEATCVRLLRPPRGGPVRGDTRRPRGRRSALTAFSLGVSC